MTGDISGLEFRFQLASDGGLTSLVRDAAGGLPPARAVDSLAYDASQDTLTLWYSGDHSSYSYRVRVSCTALEGSARLWMTTADPEGSVHPVAFSRVRSPMPDRTD